MLRSHATLSLLITLFAAPLFAAGSIPWRTDLRAAQAEAQQQNKLVLLHFWSESCGPCRSLDKRVFSIPSVGNALAANYIPVKVNATESQAIAANYGVTRVPTDVVISPTGEVVQSFVSPATPMAYVAAMTKLSSSYHSRQGSTYDRVAQAAPVRSGFGTSGPAVNNAYRGLGVAATSTPVADNPKIAPVNAAPPLPPVTPIVENPYAAAADKQAASAPPQAAVTPVPQPTVAAPIVPAPVVTQELAQQETTAQQLPPGSPPLGFDGYCPVTMKDQWQWQKGDVRWGAVHRGRTYLFVSEVLRDKFMASPDTYSPALSGADPVMAVDSQQSVDGMREYALEYRGKFYFFSSEQTLNKFWTNADGYVQGAQRVAQSLTTDGTLTR